MKMNLRILEIPLLAAVLSLLVVSCSKSSVAQTSGRAVEKFTGSPSDPAVELKAKWKPDNRYTLRMEITRRAQRPQRRQSELVQHEFTFGQDYALSVTNAQPEGSLGLDLQILSLEASTMVGDNYTLNFDSENHVETSVGDILNDPLRATIGSHIYYLLDPAGKVLQVTGARELLQRTTGSNATASATLRRIYNPEYFREILELCTALPENPVTVNGTWPFKREVTIGGGAPLTAEGTCTFRGWQSRENHKCAAIDVNGTLQPKQRALRTPPKLTRQADFVAIDVSGETVTNQSTQGPMAALPMNSGIEDGKITGRIWFDPELGLPVETSLDESYSTKGFVPMRQNQTNSEPKSYTSPVTQKVTLKLTEVAQKDAPTTN